MAKPTYNFEISGRKGFVLCCPRRIAPQGIKKSPLPKEWGHLFQLGNFVAQLTSLFVLSLPECKP